MVFGQLWSGVGLLRAVEIITHVFSLYLFELDDILAVAEPKLLKINHALAAWSAKLQT